MTDECSICHCRTCELTSVRGQIVCEECAPAVVDPPEEIAVETYCGNLVSLTNPDSATICIDDIAWALAHQVRFNGHCSEPYTVADHSIACSRRARSEGMNALFQLGALMHDAAEAYIGDVVSPVKLLIRDIIKPIEDHLADVIWVTLCNGLPTEHSGTLIKEIDILMLATEAFRLMPSKGRVLGGSTSTLRGVPIPPPSMEIAIYPGRPLVVASTFVSLHAALYHKALREQA